MAVDENHIARMITEARDATLEQNKRIDALTAGIGEMNTLFSPWKFEREQILRDIHDHGQKIDGIDTRLRVVEAKHSPITVVVPQPGPAVATAETTTRVTRRYPTSGLASRIVAATNATRVKLALLVIGMMLGTAMLAVLASVLIITRG